MNTSKSVHYIEREYINISEADPMLSTPDKNLEYTSSITMMSSIPLIMVLSTKMPNTTGDIYSKNQLIVVSSSDIEPNIYS
jgi:hypothetical protein